MSELSQARCDEIAYLKDIFPTLGEVGWDDADGECVLSLQDGWWFVSRTQADSSYISDCEALANVRLWLWGRVREKTTHTTTNWNLNARDGVTILVCPIVKGEHYFGDEYEGDTLLEALHKAHQAINSDNTGT